MTMTPEQIAAYNKRKETERAAEKGNAQSGRTTPDDGLIGRVNRTAETGAKTARKAFDAGRMAQNAVSKTIDNAAAAGERVFEAVDPIAEPIVKAGVWAAPKLARRAGQFGVFMVTKKDEDGHRHFSPWTMAKKFVTLAGLLTATPIVVTGGYYYSTLRIYKNVYIPNAGVMMTEQFEHPDGAGQTIAPRDEIWTVTGKQIKPDGRIRQLRFDIDTNWYFPFDGAAMRPDLAASEMNSQSPYGEVCTFKTTGFYNLLPRYARFWAVKWWNVRAEIVKVDSCDNVQSLPSQFYNQQDMDGSIQFDRLPKGRPFTMPSNLAALRLG